MKTRLLVPCSRPLLLAAAMLVPLGMTSWLLPPGWAGTELAPADLCRAATPVAPVPVTACDLKRMCAAELEQVFAVGKVSGTPVGPLSGRVLLVVSSRSPRLRAQMMNAVWKGKLFFPDGTLTNLWFCGIQTSPGCSTIEPSWFDEKPCIVLEYPPGTLVFANAHDELREIAPGLFLGRFYQRCPCPKLKAYFMLERCGDQHGGPDVSELSVK